MSGRWLALCLLLVIPTAARAHDGPPFPILLGEPAGPYKLSVWTDPDVGIGTFFVYVEASDGSSTEDVTVTVHVKPVNGRLPEAGYPAEPRDEGRRVQHYA